VAAKKKPGRSLWPGLTCRTQPTTSCYFLRDVFLLERFFAVFFFGLLRALATVPSFCSKVVKV